LFFHILKTFSAEEGWPFPRAIGVCGRFFVEEYIGPSLVEWLPRANWKQRVHAAYQMLQIAQKFTIGVNGFRLYPNDLSIYNIAVDQKGNVKIIDAENIIIVDLEQIRQRKYLINIYVTCFLFFKKMYTSCLFYRATIKL